MIFLVKTAFYFMVGYVGLLAFMYLSQRALQYYPDRSYPGTPSENDLPEMREVEARTADGITLLAWFAPPQEEKGKIVVFFHGNAGHIGHRAIKARYFLEHGYGVYFCEYRGYGGNEGRPTEQGLYRDGRAAIQWLEDQGYSVSQMVLYGESIGSGVAVQLAQEMQPPILILEAPFLSAAAVAKEVYTWLPVDLLLKDRFDNEAKIKDVRSRLLVVHGDEDGVVPFAQGAALYALANHPKDFVDIHGGGHNDLYEHHAGHIILDWLAAQP